MQTKKSLLAIAFLVFLNGCGEESAIGLPIDTTDFSLSVVSGDTQTKILSYVNQVRGEARDCGSVSYESVVGVIWDDRLEDAAQRHSLDMDTHTFLSHTGSDGSDVAERVTDEGYTWTTVGENIYQGATASATAEDAVAAWMESPGHCANIMNSAFTEIGAAQSGKYWTLVLADQ